MMSLFSQIHVFIVYTETILVLFSKDLHSTLFQKSVFSYSGSLEIRASTYISTQLKKVPIRTVQIATVIYNCNQYNFRTILEQYCVMFSKLF